MIRGFYRDRIQGVSMASRLHRQMAQSRSALNRGHGYEFTLEERAELDAESERRRSAALQERTAAAVRVHHPAITMPEHKCFKAIRRWKGEDFGECIGFSKDAGGPLLIIGRERGWAEVLDPNGKRISFNWQKLTTKPAEIA